MPAPGEYERQQIDALLHLQPSEIEPGAALVLLPIGERFDELYQTAIAPALATNGLNRTQVHRVFTHDSPLADVCESLRRAELIIADITSLNPTIMYVLGLSHALGRSPILIARYFSDLPFNLSGLRCIQYSPRDWGFVTLRKQLIRAVRIFLTASHQP